MNDIPFADYLRRFDYDERVAMKIQLPELLKLYAEGQVQLIDIRFNEEYAAWRVGIGRHIPLNELPDRLDELDPNKTIVTMCPHYDRAEIARLFLTLKGFHARYLTDEHARTRRLSARGQGTRLHGTDRHRNQHRLTQESNHERSTRRSRRRYRPGADGPGQDFHRCLHRRP
ncbi:MAG: rhodanese-like domain-containing protein [Chromatiales bacterium]|nr:rhodanese-like domain-containing protein [Chromatiales bacterium]